MATLREPKFSVGQRIEWSSQSAGVWKKKVGLVVAIVGVNEGIENVLKSLGYDPENCVVHAQSSALVPRYLVDTTVDGRRVKNQIYAPDLARAEKRGRVLKRR